MIEDVFEGKSGDLGAAVRRSGGGSGGANVIRSCRFPIAAEGNEELVVEGSSPRAASKRNSPLTFDLKIRRMIFLSLFLW